MSRWIAISTDLLSSQHRWHPHATGEEACRLGAWIDLIGLAAWRDHGGLKRGQLRASQSFLAARWNWHRSKVQRFLSELESDGAIQRDRPANNQRVITTICHYNAYQPSRATNRSTNRSRSRSSNRSEEVKVDINTPRARARKNGDRRQYQRREPIDYTATEPRPEAIRAIMESLRDPSLQ